MVALHGGTVGLWKQFQALRAAVEDTSSTSEKQGASSSHLEPFMTYMEDEVVKKLISVQKDIWFVTFIQEALGAGKKDDSIEADGVEPPPKEKKLV